MSPAPIVPSARQPPAGNDNLGLRRERLLAGRDERSGRHGHRSEGPVVEHDRAGRRHLDRIRPRCRHRGGCLHRAALLDGIVDPDLVGDRADRLAGGHDRDRRRRKHGRAEHARADDEGAARPPSSSASGIARRDARVGSGCGGADDRHRARRRCRHPWRRTSTARPARPSPSPRARHHGRHGSRRVGPAPRPAPAPPFGHRRPTRRHRGPPRPPASG